MPIDPLCRFTRFVERVARHRSGECRNGCDVYKSVIKTVYTHTAVNKNYYIIINDSNRNSLSVYIMSGTLPSFVMYIDFCFQN